MYDRILDVNATLCGEIFDVVDDAILNDDSVGRYDDASIQPG